MTPEGFRAVITNIRTGKHKAALDVTEQCAAAGQKEQ